MQYNHLWVWAVMLYKQQTFKQKCVLWFCLKVVGLEHVLVNGKLQEIEFWASVVFGPVLLEIHCQVYYLKKKCSPGLVFLLDMTFFVFMRLH